MRDWQLTADMGCYQRRSIMSRTGASAARLAVLKITQVNCQNTRLLLLFENPIAPLSKTIKTRTDIHRNTKAEISLPVA